MTTTSPWNIALFCSGSGSNAEKIMEHFADNQHGKVVLLLSNKSDAYALERAKKYHVPSLVFNKESFYNSDSVLKELKDKNVQYIVLAGFLWLMPANILHEYHGRIINIHPALLPKFGGKGMYGHHVHEAVVAAKEKESGMTIHHVNAHYDEGNIIFQAKCPIYETDDADAVAKKVLVLEHKYFSVIIEEEIKKLKGKHLL